MFRFLRIAAGIAIVAGFAMLPFLPSGTEAASLPSNTTVSAIGISPQDDNVRIVGISSGRVFATTAGAPLLAEVTPPVSTRRFIGRAIIDPKDVKTAYVTLTGYGVPDGQHIWRQRTSIRARRLRQSPGLLPGTVFPMCPLMRSSSIQMIRTLSMPEPISACIDRSMAARTGSRSRQACRASLRRGGTRAIPDFAYRHTWSWLGAVTNLVYSVTYNPLLNTLKSQLIKP